MLIWPAPILVTVAPVPMTIVCPNSTCFNSWFNEILDVLIPVIKVVVTPIVAIVVKPTVKNVDSVAWIVSPGINAACVVPIPTFDILRILVSVSHSLTLASIPDESPLTTSPLSKLPTPLISYGFAIVTVGVTVYPIPAFLRRISEIVLSANRFTSAAAADVLIPVIVTIGVAA